MSEESKCKCEDIKDYKTAFECFKQRFLIEKKSIFRLDCDEEILNTNSIKYLEKNFINNGFIGDGGKKENQTTSTERFYRQLIKKDKGIKNTELDNVAINAIEVLATAVWLWRLPASNTNGEGRRKSVYEILCFIDDEKCPTKKKTETKETDNSFFGNYNGFAMPGIGYNTNKANELAYIILFFEKFLKNGFDNKAIIKYLKENQKVNIETKHIYTKEKDKYILKELKESKKEENQIFVNNGLLHLFDNDNYEPILANLHKDKIVAVFGMLFKKELNSEYNNLDRDGKIAVIKEILQTKKKDAGFYDKDIKNIWLGGIDFESKNMILHGAPGTGKTYLTEQTVKTRNLIEGNVEYNLVQFHPSYGYEDFIEGIKPTKIIESSGQMKFELKNGIFKQLCIDAFKNLIESKDDKSKLKIYYFIADEINRAELSRVFGELLLCLEDDKRLKIVKKTIKNKVEYRVEGTRINAMPNSNLWEAHHAVVILDDQDNIVNLDEEGNYKLEKNKTYKYFFGVPENIYFIGTMNDIDRSVDSFDMALRRRFVWKHYRCDYDVIYETYSDKKNVEKYIETCKDLNRYITNNLGNSYELGHFYFMKPKSLTQTALDRVWLESIAPLLKEYLRSEFNEDDLEKELKKAKKIFKL